MSISQTNFENIRQYYDPVFTALERAMANYDIDFYLIGAQARDVWTNHLLMDKRITRDIDFAVYVSSIGDWNKLSAYLIEKQNFKRDSTQPYRFYHGDLMLDLVPFGGIEVDGEVILENPHLELSVYGCREVTAQATVISHKYKVITLPGLCIMKLIAYDENPDRRQKDWDDFVLIVTNYGDIAGEQLFDGKFDDLIVDNFELSVASARMMGRHFQMIVNKNAYLKERIVQILENKLQKYSQDEIDQMYRVNDGADQQVILLKLVSEILKGLARE
jgi:predicted nucleotidyltransferase